jgi:ankyrin repeat protein
LHGLDDARHIGFTVDDARIMMADIVITYLAYGVFETQMTKTAIRPIMAHSAPSKILQSTMGSSSTTRQLAMKLLGSRKQPTFDLSKTLAEARGSLNPKPEHVFTFYAYANIHWQDHIWDVSGRSHRIHQLSANLIQTRYSEIRDVDKDFGRRCRWAAKHGSLRLLELICQKTKALQGQDGAVTYDIDTPLFWAIDHGDKDVVKILLEADVDVNKEFRSWHSQTIPRVTKWEVMNWEEKLSPLILAVKKEDTDIVELLLEIDKLAVNTKDHKKLTAFVWALEKRNMEIIKLLLKDKRTEIEGEPTGDWAPLLAAALQRDKDVLQLLLFSDRVDVDLKTKIGESALMLAASEGHQEIVELLVATGKFDLNAINDRGQSALMLAASEGHEGIVELLLAIDGIDIHTRGEDGKTALSMALSQKHKDVVEMLQSASLRIAADSLVSANKTDTPDETT